MGVMLWDPFPESGVEGVAGCAGPEPRVTWPVYRFQNHRHPRASGARGCGDELEAAECGVCGV